MSNSKQTSIPNNKTKNLNIKSLHAVGASIKKLSIEPAQVPVIVNLNELTAVGLLYVGKQPNILIVYSPTSELSSFLQ